MTHWDSGLIQQLVLNGVIAGSVYSLVALGFTVIYRTVRFFHLAHGAVYAGAAYLTYTFEGSFGVNRIGAIAVAVIVATGFGVGVERYIYAPLRRQRAPNLVFLIASFGVLIVVQSFIQLIYGADTFSLRKGPATAGLEIFSAAITPVQVAILCASILVAFSMWLFMHRTRLGSSMRAVADDPIGASVVGINPATAIQVAFAVGSAGGALAGILVSLETNIEPTMGFSAVLKGVVAAIVGGIGSIPGAMIGGLCVGMLENLAIWKIQAGWKDTVTFVALIIFLLIRPGGILGVRIDGGRV